MDAEDELRRAWLALAPAHPGAVERLLVRLREPHRHYHTARHVAAVLAHLRTLGVGQPELVAAALFHDAIYDASSTSNEIDSAHLAVDELTAIGWDAARCHTVQRLIMATARHESSDDLEAALLDADLAILGAPPAVYDVYVVTVRSEYAHVSDTDWRSRRRAVLRSFLDRPAIFRTPAMAAAREAAARANIQRELAALDA